MLSLSGQARTITDLVARKRRLDKHVQEAQGFLTRESNVEDVRRKLEPLLTSVRLLRKRGIADVGVPGMAESIKAIVSLRESLERDPSFVLGASALNNLRFAAERVTAQLGARVATAWLAYAEPQLPSVNDEVLAVLGKIPALAVAISEIRGGRKRLQDILTESVTEASINDFEQKINEVRNAWDRFDEGHMPKGVLNFLKEAAGAGAALDMITPEVLSWLRGHGIAGAFRVRASS